VIYVLSVVMAILIPFGITVGGLAPELAPGPYLERNTITFCFGIFTSLLC